DFEINPLEDGGLRLSSPKRFDKAPGPHGRCLNGCQGISFHRQPLNTIAGSNLASLTMLMSAERQQIPISAPKTRASNGQVSTNGSCPSEAVRRPKSVASPTPRP